MSENEGLTRTRTDGKTWKEAPREALTPAGEARCQAFRGVLTDQCEAPAKEGEKVCEEHAARVLTMSRGGEPYTRCQAASRQNLRQCLSPAIPGGMVCRHHGGEAPHVKRKAAIRLNTLVEPAIATLAKEMVGAEKSADRQRAANSILDRAGVTRQTTVSVEDARSILLTRLSAMRAGQRALPLAEDSRPDVVAGEVEG